MKLINNKIITNIFMDIIEFFNIHYEQVFVWFIPKITIIYARLLHSILGGNFNRKKFAENVD